MNKEKTTWKRQVIQYIIGLFVMALGIVFIKKAGIGMSPISSIPNALYQITNFSLGTMVTAFGLFCLVVMIIVNRKIDLKTILTCPLTIGFGFIIDLYMFLLKFDEIPIVVRVIVCVAGVILTALGIVIIVGSDLMLPAPDALLRAISAKYGWPLSRVKIVGDAIWVVTALLIEIFLVHHISSVNVGTIISVIFTGRFVGIFNKHFGQYLTIKKEEKKTVS